MPKHHLRLLLPSEYNLNATRHSLPNLDPADLEAATKMAMRNNSNIIDAYGTTPRPGKGSNSAGISGPASVTIPGERVSHHHHSMLPPLENRQDILVTQS